jgi:hypothetical protein
LELGLFNKIAKAL